MKPWGRGAFVEAALDFAYFRRLSTSSGSTPKLPDVRGELEKGFVENLSSVPKPKSAGLVAEGTLALAATPVCFWILSW